MQYVLYGVIVIGLMGDIGGGVYLWGLLEARKAERENPTVLHRVPRTKLDVVFRRGAGLQRVNRPV